MVRWLDFRVWQQFRNCDWGHENYQVSKSLLTCAFSKLAYASIPAIELTESDRVKIIPCEAYQEAVRLGRDFSLSEILTEEDVPVIFELQSRLSISVGLRMQDILFVAIRGTLRLYDWLINLDARTLTDVTQCGTQFSVHRGFNEAAQDIAEAIANHALDSDGQPLFRKIVFCGHSLGGAIAANLFAKCSQCSAGSGLVKSSVWDSLTEKVEAECYVFGAPRFRSSSSYPLRLPRLVAIPGDIVPTLPPKLLGYTDYMEIYDCAGQMKATATSESLGSTMGWIMALATLNGIADHKVERYLAQHLNALPL